METLEKGQKGRLSRKNLEKGPPLSSEGRGHLGHMHLDDEREKRRGVKPSSKLGQGKGPPVRKELVVPG